MKIHNAAVLITGGSRGLGRALGMGVAAGGGRVVLVARNRLELDRTVAEIRGEANGVNDVAEPLALGWPIVAGQGANLVPAHAQPLHERRTNPSA